VAQVWGGRHTQSDRDPALCLLFAGVFYSSLANYCFEGVNVSLATKSILHFQKSPLVVCDMHHSQSENAYVGTFVNVMFNIIFGGTVAFALIKLTTAFGGAVIAFIGHFWW
jgi:hypothetical protein